MVSQSLTLLHMSLAAQDSHELYFQAMSLQLHCNQGVDFILQFFYCLTIVSMKKITAKRFEEIFNNGELKVLNCKDEVKFLVCSRTRSEDKIQALRSEIEEKERFLFSIQDPLDRRSLEREIRTLEFEMKKSLGFWSEKQYKLVLRDQAQENHLVEVLEQSH